MVAKILVNTGATTKVQAMIYKAVVQAVLLYRGKIWVAKDTMMTVLEGFFHRIARQGCKDDSKEGQRQGMGVGHM